MLGGEIEVFYSIRILAFGSASFNGGLPHVSPAGGLRQRNNFGMALI